MSPSVRSLVAPALASLIGVAVLVGLGVWQLRRLAWKDALVAAVATRARAAPVDAPAEADWAKLKPADYEYRHVRLVGVYDASRQALVFRALSSPRGRYGGPGYLVMTPLRLAPIARPTAPGVTCSRSGPSNRARITRLWCEPSASLPRSSTTFRS